ncbi:MAG: hypothetical protein G01um101472_394 [Parcubacteria group bacterium Gr01-1014_72]|nr:MAG: hypothetical protein G01um101472_394 [Parcubacteria group bacterium Gr01-1014_72]
MYSLRTFLKTHERGISVAALILGFIVDNFTLRRADLFLENLALLLYLSLVAICIIVLNFHGEVREGTARASLNRLLFFAMQFAVGGLMSAFLIFYSRSASIIASWPFLLVILLQFVGSELFKRQYTRLTLQVSVFFFALLSYTILAVPTVLGKIGADVFIVSGIVSLITVKLFLMVLRRTARERYAANRQGILVSIAGIVSVVTFFYFSNLIPPIPLALKEIGVYKSVIRLQSGEYLRAGGERRILGFTVPGQIVRIAPGEPLYAWSAIFAPTRFSEQIVHRWEYYDETRGAWETRSRIPLAIVGGRDGGYRTYSFKRDFSSGRWRVGVETTSGQIIGRIVFSIEYSSPLP